MLVGTGGGDGELTSLFPSSPCIGVTWDCCDLWLFGGEMNRASARNIDKACGAGFHETRGRGAHRRECHGCEPEGFS